MVKVLYTPIGGQGKPYVPNLRNILFRKQKMQQKQNKNKTETPEIGHTVSKWRPKTHLKFHYISLVEKPFPKGFFHKRWLINKECKYNYYIAEIKLEHLFE